MSKSPTELSLDLLRKDGYLAQVVEKWVPGANIRKDLFGFIDILAIGEDRTIAVQCTSYSNISDRVKKISESDTVSAVRKANWVIEVHGWRKVGNRWTVKRIDLS